MQDQVSHELFNNSARGINNANENVSRNYNETPKKVGNHTTSRDSSPYQNKAQIAQQR